MTMTSTAFDTGPLSWVIGEVRDALASSGAAVRDATARSLPAQPTMLLHAKTHLHQAHGALQMVDVLGVGVLAEAAEQALDRFKDGALACTIDNAQPVLEAFQALSEYLEELMAGQPPQPLRLFPYHRALQELLGAQRVHPSDLMELDLSAEVDWPAPTGPVTAPDYAACRARFEKALLPFLKSLEADDQRSHAEALQEAIAPIAHAQQEPQARTFWQAMHSVTQLVAQGQLASDLYLKQLFGQINLQVRRLAQGQGSLPDAMLRDALFFIAAAKQPHAEAQLLRRTFGIDNQVPDGYAERRYGKIDQAALRQAREALAQAKSDWDRLAGSGGDSKLEQGFAQGLARLAAAGDKLGVPALARLLHAIAHADAGPGASGRGEQFGLEMAAALLFAEHGLDQVRQLPDEFGADAEAIGARLLALAQGETPPEPPQGELARRLQQERSLAVLAGEIGNGLRQVEKLLDAYHENLGAGSGAVVGQAGPLLHQIEGALAILDQDQAVRAVRHVKSGVDRLAAAGQEDSAALLENIAHNVTALGFFTNLLAQNGEVARARYIFDEAAGLLREGMDVIAPVSGEVHEPVAPAPATAEAGGEGAIEAELLEIFIAEAQEVLAFVGATLPAARLEPANQDLLAMLRRSFHTLKGSGRMVGLEHFAQTAAAIERVMNLWLAECRSASADLLALLEAAHAELAAWVAELAADGMSSRIGEALVAAATRVQEDGPFVLDQPVQAATPESTVRVGEREIPAALHNIYQAEAGQLVRALAQDLEQWRAEPARPASSQAIKAAHTLAGTSATVGFAALRDLAGALEAALERLAIPDRVLDDAGRDLLDATRERAQAMLDEFAHGDMAPEQPELMAQLDTLGAAVAMIDAASESAQGLDALFAATYESLLTGTPEGQPLAPIEAIEEQSVDLAAEADDNRFDAAEMALAPPLLEQAAQDEPAAASVQAERPAAETLFSDDLDPDLLPVFLEEAADLFPQIGKGLRQWQQDLADPAQAQHLLRALHTVKGSARMAGAMRLGQHTHELETQIERMVHGGGATADMFDELMASYDQALLLFEQLQQGESSAAPARGPVPEPARDAADGTRTPLVRVRADVLDRLVNQSGEVSITRSRIETRFGSLKTALADFSDHLARLRRQLREVELQAESQIASRLSISGEREFDPLEFDRFTRLQELTRMMAESVSDVASFHESLARTVDGAGADLASQSRLTRDLQRDLMRVRMVPFASLSERLFRVARQTAKETDKRVNLDIRGGAVEIDRSVLEQMAAPFEHLLRNAIVHGVETREQRALRGKPETGELLIQVSQQGNEVAIEFSDDGAGLDLARIRAKARASALLAEDAEVSDAQAAEFIFAPGFSTAQALTELAGRGVGMDVVRSEAQALGGRVAVASEPGKGTRFTIRLPLTLAVAQVVLVAAGGRTHALPSTLVEQVLQVRDAELEAAHAAGALTVQGQRVALHALPALLGETASPSAPRRSSPVMILKSGDERMALWIDEVLGNREVVVKNIGVQLSRVAGISGATVLGSGDIVLILDPLALAQRGAWRRMLAANAPGQQAVRRHVIMVVDDSLTVRKVTQRLLEREGYQVMLAKDGVDALEQLQEARPDLMLVDIEMPRMDGFDLTRHVRGNAATQAIPIVMVTSRTADKHRNYALGLGVNAYFGKPFQEPVLLAAILELLGSGVAEPVG
ncbi:hybrid sensor histidine kinase/response regulator [Massilia horti]|uniref:Chemotaxis protein CheA n=1 Tax=Massilia horti TaxID=2562153 RepID=A0A4Y9T6P5_9BURK|nr:Hpt domain-containing protein [Massilia horti]TFW34000.1 response regulator [Massilia horti]